MPSQNSRKIMVLTGSERSHEAFLARSTRQRGVGADLVAQTTRRTVRLAKMMGGVRG